MGGNISESRFFEAKRSTERDLHRPSLNSCFDYRQLLALNGLDLPHMNLSKGPMLDPQDATFGPVSQYRANLSRGLKVNSLASLGVSGRSKLLLPYTIRVS